MRVIVGRFSGDYVWPVLGDYRGQKQKAVTRGLRYDAELGKRIEAATQKGGFSCSSAFIRAAIERELAGRESSVDESEQRIAASLDRTAREIRNLRIGQQALFAFVDVLAKTFLTCVPEPPRDVQAQAVARGKARYDRFLQSLGPGLRRGSIPPRNFARVGGHWEQLPATEVGRRRSGVSIPFKSMVPRSARHTVVTALTVMAGLIPIQRVSFCARLGRC